MSKLRFDKDSEGGTNKKGWKVSRRELSRYVKSFGLGPVETDEQPLITGVTGVAGGHTVTDVDDVDVVSAELAVVPLRESTPPYIPASSNATMNFLVA